MCIETRLTVRIQLHWSQKVTLKGLTNFQFLWFLLRFPPPLSIASPSPAVYLRCCLIKFFILWCEGVVTEHTIIFLINSWLLLGCFLMLQYGTVPEGTQPGDRQDSVTQYPESYPHLMSKIYFCICFYDEFWKKTTPDYPFSAIFSSSTFSGSSWVAWEFVLGCLLLLFVRYHKLVSYNICSLSFLTSSDHYLWHLTSSTLESSFC